MSCSAFRCKNTQSKDATVLFFRFPLCDPVRLKQWLTNMGRKKWTPSASSHLCSMHFEEDQFLSDSKVNKRLKTTAVPTIFIKPPHFATQTRATQTMATKTKVTATRATQTRSTKSRSTQTIATQTMDSHIISTQTIATQTEWVSVTMEESESMVSSFVSSCSSPSYLAELHRGSGPVAHLCPVLDSEPGTNIDIQDSGSIPSADYSDMGVGLGVERGLSTQGPYVRRARKLARMNSCGYGEGPIENAFLQGPEFHATPLYSDVCVKQEPAEVVVKLEPDEENEVVVKLKPAEVVVKLEPDEENEVVVKLKPAEVVVKLEPDEETEVVVKLEPADETEVVVKQETAKETDFIDDVLPDYIFQLVIKADVNEAAAEDNADVDDVAADDITAYTTSGDSKTAILDHDYFSKKQKEIRMCSDHMYGISESPVILKRRVNELCDKLVEARQRFRLKCQETSRMKSRLMSLKSLTKGLQKKLNLLQKKFNALQKCRPYRGMVQNVQEPFYLWVPCV
ncbi:THAP domain-containing protein 5-like [Perca fluviatilis]|uniref:THAP domain-containing protein 5-like n=1 Tax=Perca fluviatilis TaxID=8168 RepID=UPI001962C0F2|nr:THAP domain-containing protein 5-like [Perca fluviatilis]